MIGGLSYPQYSPSGRRYPNPFLSSSIATSSQHKLNPVREKLRPTRSYNYPWLPTLVSSPYRNFKVGRLVSQATDNMGIARKLRVIKMRSNDE